MGILPRDSLVILQLPKVMERIATPLMVSIVTIIPAISTPRPISMMACVVGIWNIQAVRDPVHAPVMGKGIATSITRAIAPYLWKRKECAFCNRSVCHLSRAPAGLRKPNNILEIRLREGSSIRTGTILPNMATGRAMYHGTSRAYTASGIASLNSPIGVIAARNVARISIASTCPSIHDSFSHV